MMQAESGLCVCARTPPYPPDVCEHTRGAGKNVCTNTRVEIVLEIDPRAPLTVQIVKRLLKTALRMYGVRVLSTRIEVDGSQNGPGGVPRAQGAG
jgi:hypothetical protein